MNALKGSRTAKVFAGIALISASAIVIAGCSSTPSSESGGSDKPAADLTLKLGSLLPQTGSLAFLGPPMESGVGLAVQEVNEAAAGVTIDLTAEDEGDTDTKAYETSITKLQGAGVSAIVGAAASGVSKLILDGNVSAGILQISASNTSKTRSVAVRASIMNENRKPSEFIGQRSAAAIAKNAKSSPTLS